MNSRAFRGAPWRSPPSRPSAIVLAGCAGGGGGESSADSDEQITLTLATFNDFGYTDELLQEYMDENPNIKIVHNKAADVAATPAPTTSRSSARKASPTSRPSRSTGSPRPCSTPTCSPRCPTDVKGRWLDWKEAAATDADGRLVGLRHRHRPAGASATAPTCSRPPACRATPTRSPRCSSGDWDNFFDVADQYKAATGKPMIDSANSVFQGMVNQIEFTYDEPDGTVIATDNPDARGRLRPRRRARRSRTRRTPASGATTGSPRWPTASSPRCCAPAGCSASSRATRPTSPAGRSPTSSPNGGGNWGGSYLTVPANGENVEAALALADWLTAPEHAGEGVRQRGHVPEPDRGAERPGDQRDSTNAYFNDAPTGEIFADACRGRHGRPPTRAPTTSSTTRRSRTPSPASSTALEDQQTAWDTWVAEVEAF